MKEKESYMKWRQNIESKITELREIVIDEMPPVETMAHPEVQGYVILPYGSVIRELLHRNLSILSKMVELAEERKENPEFQQDSIRSILDLYTRHSTFF